MNYRRWFLLLLLIFWLCQTPVVFSAEMCRDRSDHRICVLKLKRSAKNFWEYRAEVSIDGKKQVDREIYNCRDRTLTRKGRYPIPFKPNSPGELVCSLFQK